MSNDTYYVLELRSTDSIDDHFRFVADKGQPSVFTGCVDDAHRFPTREMADERLKEAAWLLGKRYKVVEHMDMEMDDDN